MPKVIINDTIVFLSYTAISLSVTSNRNIFRVLFDKIASVIRIFLTEKYINFFGIGNGQPREPALCRLYRHSAGLVGW